MFGSVPARGVFPVVCPGHTLLQCDIRLAHGAGILVAITAVHRLEFIPPPAAGASGLSTKFVAPQITADSGG
jgi:hypothetical protein